MRLIKSSPTFPINNQPQLDHSQYSKRQTHTHTHTHQQIARLINSTQSMKADFNKTSKKSGSIDTRRSIAKPRWKRSSIIHDVSDTLIPVRLKKRAEKPRTKKPRKSETFYRNLFICAETKTDLHRKGTNIYPAFIIGAGISIGSFASIFFWRCILCANMLSTYGYVEILICGIIHYTNGMSTVRVLRTPYVPISRVFLFESEARKTYYVYF